ncbi:hypothetical protein [Blastococcus sp. SYSU DS0539]
MLTTDEIDAKPGTPASGDADYEFASTWALRGTEGRTIARWQKGGWELDNQSPGTLRTEITFRRVKPKNAWQQCVAFLAEHWSAFGRLKLMTQQLVLASAGALVVLSLVLGIVVASIVSGGTPTPAATTDAAAPSDQPAEAPSDAPSQAPAEPEPYVYQGVPYQIVVVDEDVSTADLTRYWVLTDSFDYSTDEYKNQIRMIVEDLARRNGTADLMVDVVTDREIAEAEAFSTFEAFVEEHGDDYAVNAIPRKEEEHWVASYTGGLDPDTVQPSKSADAYEIIWWNPGALEGSEQWKPALDG